jgi:23S rRNA (pseudouridine1915-N3)-methyltransferase
MKLTVVAVGKLKERHYQEACEEYVRRVQRHLPCEVIEVRDDRALAARLPTRGEVWALDERGREMTSVELARAIEGRMNGGAAAIAFVIGGADGLPATLVKSATVTLSLSRFTLAHRLARLVLLEQLYRALSIIKGEPYHRA